MKKIFLVLSVSLLLLVGCNPNKGGLMSGYKGFDKEENHFVTQDFDKIVTDLENKVPGLYFLGFSTCPWCVSLVPVMEEALTDTNMTMMYINVKDSSWNKALSDRIMNFEKTLPDDVKKSEGKVPAVFVIDNNGNVKTNIGTVEGHDAKTRELTEAESKYLRIRLTDMFSGITSQNLGKN